MFKKENKNYIVLLLVISLVLNIYFVFKNSEMKKENLNTLKKVEELENNLDICNSNNNEFPVENIPVPDPDENKGEQTGVPSENTLE